MIDTSNNKESLINDVKEPQKKAFKVREVLKKIVFIERGLTYASLCRLLGSKGVRTTRQYLYMIITGRLTPSYEFANKLCDVLGIKIQTAFDMGEFHFPSFVTADKLLEEKK